MHLCLFDIDGTLLNTGGAGQAAMEAAIASTFDVALLEVDIPAAGRTDKSIVADLFVQYGIEPTEDSIEKFQQAYVEHLPGSLGGLDGRVLPGIVEILAELTTRDDVTLGLLTGNFEHGAQLKLTHYELADYFRFGGFGDHSLHRNDVARAAVDQARNALAEAFEQHHVWVVGDTPADIECGRAIDARVIAVATGIYSYEELEQHRPDHLFRDFSQPQEFLRLITS